MGRSDRLGYRMAGRPENVGRPEAQIGPDVRQSLDDRPLRKCEPQPSVQDTDVRAGPDIRSTNDRRVSDVRKNASIVKVSDVWRVPDIRKNHSVKEH